MTQTSSQLPLPLWFGDFGLSSALLFCLLYLHKPFSRVCLFAEFYDWFALNPYLRLSHLLLPIVLVSKSKEKFTLLFNKVLGYKVDSLAESSAGLVAHLSLAGGACNAFGKDITNLTIQVSYESNARYVGINLTRSNQTQTDAFEVYMSTSLTLQISNTPFLSPLSSVQLLRQIPSQIHQT